jgi:hypothetical protein
MPYLSLFFPIRFFREDAISSDSPNVAKECAEHKGHKIEPLSKLLIAPAKERTLYILPATAIKLG